VQGHKLESWSCWSPFRALFIHSFLAGNQS
jgi:hypothetical protein